MLRLVKLRLSVLSSLRLIKTGTQSRFVCSALEPYAANSDRWLLETELCCLLSPRNASLTPIIRRLALTRYYKKSFEESPPVLFQRLLKSFAVFSLDLANLGEKGPPEAIDSKPLLKGEGRPSFLSLND